MFYHKVKTNRFYVLFNDKLVRCDCGFCYYLYSLLISLCCLAYLLYNNQVSEAMCDDSLASFLERKHTLHKVLIMDAIDMMNDHDLIICKNLIESLIPSIQNTDNMFTSNVDDVTPLIKHGGASIGKSLGLFIVLSILSYFFSFLFATLFVTPNLKAMVVASLLKIYEDPESMDHLYDLLIEVGIIT